MPVTALASNCCSCAGRLAAPGPALLLAGGRLKQRELCVVGAGRQHRRERRSPHGLRQQEALGGVALHRLHRAKIVGGLHALGADLGAEAMSKVDDSLAEAVLDLARCAPRDETAIDLDLDKRKVVEARQRGVARAEIVDRKINIIELQLVGDFARPRAVVDELVLGDLDCQSGKPRIVRPQRADERDEGR